MRSLNQNSKAGQVVVEFLLLASIILFLATGVFYQVNGSFRIYMEGWFGQNGYLECLIQEAEIPFASDGQCQKPSVRLAQGQAANQNSNGGGGGGSASLSAGSSGSSTKNNSTPSEASGGGIGATPRGGEASGKSPYVRYSGGADSSGSTFANARREQESADGSAVKRGGAGQYTGSDRVSSTGGGRAEQDGGEGTGLRRRMLENGDGSSDKARASNAELSGQGDVKSDGSGRSVVERERAKKRTLASAISEIDFGKYLKYLIIIALLLAVCFFIGSQLYQISRGNKRR